MNKYTAIYCGNGKEFTLIGVFQPNISRDCIDALKKQLFNGNWFVVELESDTPTPATEITMKGTVCQKDT